MDWKHVLELCLATKEVYTKMLNMAVWCKRNGGMGSFYRSQHELVFVFQNGKGSHINNVELGKHGRYRTNIWNYAGVNSFGKNQEDLKLHPTVKPVELIRDAILDASKRGDIVLDAFLGSGSTLIAAEKAGRTCFGVEYETRYVDTIIRRYHELTGVWAINEQSGKSYNELLKAKKKVENE
jgi:DNA modification methylase